MNNVQPLYPDAKRAKIFQDGLEYQDFVCEQISHRLGIHLQNFSSMKYQFGIGENRQGFEIKYDLPMTRTGNVSIEIAEKSHKDKEIWTPSGIYRDDNSWMYIQGNRDVLFIFAKNILRFLHKRGKYAEYQNSTVKAFRMPISEAERWAAKSIDFREPPF